jgi:hypothetical protein
MKNLHQSIESIQLFFSSTPIVVNKYQTTCKKNGQNPANFEYSEKVLVRKSWKWGGMSSRPFCLVFLEMAVSLCIL